MKLNELIAELTKYCLPAGGEELPVMIVCDHGQWPEDAYSVQTFYRRKDDDQKYGTLEDMLSEGYDEDELEQFVMIN